jgi:type I restriction enzyme S subunit
VDAFALADGKCAETRISCANEMRRSGAARQSVLAAAFVGKLVSQDPADEPSASLLERIAAKSGASTVVPKRGRKKKTTA